MDNGYSRGRKSLPGSAALSACLTFRGVSKTGTDDDAGRGRRPWAPRPYVLRYSSGNRRRNLHPLKCSGAATSYCRITFAFGHYKVLWNIAFSIKYSTINPNPELGLFHNASPLCPKLVDEGPSKAT